VANGIPLQSAVAGPSRTGLIALPAHFKNAVAAFFKKGAYALEISCSEQFHAIDPAEACAVGAGGAQIVVRDRSLDLFSSVSRRVFPWLSFNLSQLVKRDSSGPEACPSAMRSSIPFRRWTVVGVDRSSRTAVDRFTKWTDQSDPSHFRCDSGI
jgi:hypothetical protein